MAGLAIEVFAKCLTALFVVLGSGYIFPGLLDFGDSTFQTTVVFSFYLYCSLALFGGSKYRLFHVLSIPIFTQFLHLFQKYSFPAGANSIWRLFPFLLLDSYIFSFLLRTNLILSKRERLFVISWISINISFLAISPNFENIYFGGILLFLITLPMYFLYLGHMVKATDFAPELEKYFFCLFVILGVGTFGLVTAGAVYKGSENLLVTRNISDTNVTMAYFILLWPFALLYARRSRGAVILIITLLLLFISVVVLSFSRGAVFIITPYLILTVFSIFKAKQVRWFTLIMCMLAMLLPPVHDLGDQNLSYSWNLRFGDLRTFASVFDKLHTTSGRSEIHSLAYNLFLEKPVFGHGIGSFEVLGPGYREAHSLWYTLLAEQGVAGTFYIYYIFAKVGASAARLVQTDKRNVVILLGFGFYLVFVHTVGSVFVILPAKSVTVNCIAPILLLCLYYYSQSILLASKTEDLA